MANYTFLFTLLLTIVALTLPDPASTSISPGSHSVSSQSQSAHTARSPKAASGTEAPKSVYIITLKDGTTREQFQAYKQQLIKQGTDVKFDYELIKGFAISIAPSQVQSFKTDPLIKSIEKDSEVHIA
ncbi:hypothetical protein MJO29_016084 [Puccinia striiformis f. sp. tritici]|uniref:Inhibitor I9 domain-containing protein n=1 Tax=Puccinia striiformis f. sp. tritici PST-78 TaxID=1165861 RepID=A0A0L0VVP4_9BASI|nr:hypothetical protein Pst134EA_030365 [Puccinia striiformis f. sp. tritici]KAH9446446.1 hypothetical protein Pst134EA_030365 [Puccinia striiformis f. sp. tritici]KAI7934821.1 hypothetical protein MJO29_016084 [Puccinia striiformis f. sp. tritici]KAI9599946.1 hypothetical protein KEM48_000057 [Puccinia striiformis f. sp. tritici PST-130]KNF03055.1 hypothetical protein PSTG_03647 [Puccinia striiformis f. sp. tritici PST-78]